MAAYNADRYIHAAIVSVINQDYQNWELLIINDGSSDNTEQIVQSFNHPQITYIYQTNKGVSSARNQGLQRMKGDYFCFLDADDIFKPNSLSSRMEIFLADKSIDFVDGCVEIKSNDLQKTISIYRPKFKGNPLDALLNISRECFFGNTWLIKRDATKSYLFEEDIRHAEDLLFFISISTTGNYSFTNQIISEYRQSNDSAMSNTLGLELGYAQMIMRIRNNRWASKEQLRKLKKRIALIMFKTYLKKLKPIKAVFTYTKFMSL